MSSVIQKDWEPLFWLAMCHRTLNIIKCAMKIVHEFCSCFPVVGSDRWKNCLMKNHLQGLAMWQSTFVLTVRHYHRVEQVQIPVRSLQLSMSHLSSVIPNPYFFHLFLWVTIYLIIHKCFMYENVTKIFELSLYSFYLEFMQRKDFWVICEKPVRLTKEKIYNK